MRETDKLITYYLLLSYALRRRMNRHLNDTYACFIELYFPFVLSRRALLLAVAAEKWRNENILRVFFVRKCARGWTPPKTNEATLRYRCDRFYIVHPRVAMNVELRLNKFWAEAIAAQTIEINHLKYMAHDSLVANIPPFSILSLTMFILLSFGTVQFINQWSIFSSAGACSLQHSFIIRTRAI